MQVGTHSPQVEVMSVMLMFVFSVRVNIANCVSGNSDVDAPGVSFIKEQPRNNVFWLIVAGMHTHMLSAAILHSIPYCTAPSYEKVPQWIGTWYWSGVIFQSFLVCDTYTDCIPFSCLAKRWLLRRSHLKSTFHFMQQWCRGSFRCESSHIQCHNRSYIRGLGNSIIV